jgi:hypothetical protein
MDKWCCGECGNNFDENQGTIYQDSEYHQSFACNDCLGGK